MPHRPLAFAAILLALAACGAGCGTKRVTDTPRTGTEQLLIAAAVDAAVDQLDFAFLEDRKTFIDPTYVDRIDRDFLVASVRSKAFQAGVVVVPAAEEADYVIELRAGAVGVDRNDYVLGIPETMMPTPGGGVPLPEAAAFKSIDQMGACRLSFVAYRRDDRRLFYASGPVYGFSDEKSWWVLGAGPGTKGNIAPPRTPQNTATARQKAVSPSELPDMPE